MLGAIFGDVRDELREFELIYATNISHKEHKKYRCNEASIYKHVKKKKEERKIKLAHNFVTYAKLIKIAEDSLCMFPPKIASIFRLSCAETFGK